MIDRQCLIVRIKANLKRNPSVITYYIFIAFKPSNFAYVFDNSNAIKVT